MSSVNASPTMAWKVRFSLWLISVSVYQFKANQVEMMIQKCNVGRNLVGVVGTAEELCDRNIFEVSAGKNELYHSEDPSWCHQSETEM